ncbi:MAG: Hsp20/alpha crystallin family protein [Pirellulaceae bacterium]
MVSTLSTQRLPKSFESVQREMDTLLDQFFGNGRAAQAWYAPASLWEGEEHFHIEVDMPGVSHDDVELTFEKGVLRIAAERKPADEKRKYWHQERRYGRIERLVQLPDTVDPESIDAELRHGVLFVTLSKKPEAQPKKITVKVG